MKNTKERYSNDRTAPRMKKAKYSTPIISKELWKDFCLQYPEHKMTWSEFLSKWGDISKTIREETVTNELGVKLGSYTGELKTQYLPNKFNCIDNSTSDQLGENVKHVSLVTRGKTARIKWERRWAVKFNKMLQFFAFDAVRDIHTIAGKYIDDYPERLRVARNTLGGYSIWRQI